jgi:small-conductance mechanosensitive channel
MSGTVSLPRARLSKKYWTAPKSREWFFGFLATTVALVLLFAVALFFGDISPARGAGLAFGILGALLLFLCMALSLRKRFKHKQLGRTMHWLQFHMYAGTVFLFLLFLHTGFGLPSGLQTWLLFLLSLFVAVSGLVGAWLQKWIPHTMSRGLQVEAIYERIPDLIAGLRAEAEEIVKGASISTARSSCRRSRAPSRASASSSTSPADGSSRWPSSPTCPRASPPPRRRSSRT